VSQSSENGSPALSKRELVSLYRDVQNGQVTEAQIDRLWSQIDQQTKRDAIQTALDQFVIPHLQGIKTRAADDPDPEVIRQQYAELSDERQQQVFNQAISDVVGALFEVRENPKAGLLSLKGLIRDPYTMEGLLLIFDNEEHIDPAYSRQMKEFAAMHLKWMGVALAPESYPAAAVREVYEQLDLDIEHDPRED
jgi:hypothetical protein